MYEHTHTKKGHISNTIEYFYILQMYYCYFLTNTNQIYAEIYEKLRYSFDNPHKNMFSRMLQEYIYFVIDSNTTH